MSIDKVIELIEKQMVLTLMKNQNSTTMSEIYENSVNAAKACKQIREIFSGKDNSNSQEGHAMQHNNFDPLRPMPIPPRMEQPRVEQPRVEQPRVFGQEEQKMTYPAQDAGSISPFGLADQRQEWCAPAPQPTPQPAPQQFVQPRPQYNPAPQPVVEQQQGKDLDEARAELTTVIEEIHEMNKSIMLLQRTVVDRVGELQGRVNTLYTRVYTTLNKLG